MSVRTTILLSIPRVLLALMELVLHVWSLQRLTPVQFPSRQISLKSLHRGRCDGDEPLNLAHAYVIGDETSLEELWTNVTFNNCISFETNSHKSSVNENPGRYGQLDETARRAAEETWNWCAKFVVPNNLCPWATASVRNSESSIQIFLVRGRGSIKTFERAVFLVSQLFQLQLSPRNGANALDPNKAIAFVIQCPPSGSSKSLEKDKDSLDIGSLWDFHSFYEWYQTAENDMLNDFGPLLVATLANSAGSDPSENEFALDEESETFLADVVTWAPFHPKWSYAGDDDLDAQRNEDPLDLEKQSPHPTVSIVSTRVIEEAGPCATERIAFDNQRTLSNKTMREWRDLYNEALFQKR